MDLQPIALFKINNQKTDEENDMIVAQLRVNIEGYNVIVVFSEFIKDVELECFNLMNCEAIDLEELKLKLNK